MTGALVIAAVFVGSLAWVCWCFLTAPYGWEDEKGFHYGREPEGSDQQRDMLAGDRLQAANIDRKFYRQGTNPSPSQPIPNQTSSHHSNS